MHALTAEDCGHCLLCVTTTGGIVNINAESSHKFIAWHMYMCTVFNEAKCTNVHNTFKMTLN